MDEYALKTQLTAIHQGEAEEEQNLSEIITAMIEHIGSPDSDLRENLIYQTLSRYIEDNRLSDEMLTDHLKLALSDDYLFYEIGDVGTDHIFKRASAVLLIKWILTKDLERAFLSLPLLDKARNELVLYLDLEQDLRGYIPEKGWACTIAHTADAIDVLVKNPKLDVEQFPSIYEALVNKVFTATIVYVDDEEEHLLAPIVTMLGIGLSIETVSGLSQKVPVFLELQKEKMEEGKYVRLYKNSKNFLKSMYIATEEKEEWLPIHSNINVCLTNINQLHPQRNYIGKI